MVGGRAYFEISIYGNNILSFTTKGFWDQLGYVEPVNDSVNTKAIVWSVIAVVILLLGVLTYFCCCYSKDDLTPKKKKVSTEQQKPHTD